MNLMLEIITQFGNRKKPEIMYDLHYPGSKPDLERVNIQNKFASKDLNTFTTEDSSMMLVDFSLINDEAIIYFLPKLVEYVLNVGTHEDFLYKRLSLVEPGLFTPEEYNLVETLIFELMELEREKMEGTI